MWCDPASRVLASSTRHAWRGVIAVMVVLSSTTALIAGVERCARCRRVLVAVEAPGIATHGAGHTIAVLPHRAVVTCGEARAVCIRSAKRAVHTRTDVAAAHILPHLPHHTVLAHRGWIAVLVVSAELARLTEGTASRTVLARHALDAACRAVGVGICAPRWTRHTGTGALPYGRGVPRLPRQTRYAWCRCATVRIYLSCNARGTCRRAAASVCAAVTRHARSCCVGVGVGLARSAKAASTGATGSVLTDCTGFANSNAGAASCGCKEPCRAK